MLDPQLEHAQDFVFALNLRAPSFRIIGGILFGQELNRRPLFSVLIDDPNTSERDRAPELGCIFLGNDLIAIDHAERSLFAAANRVDFMP